ncbi:MAG TPA: hypothetical protein VJO34_05235 [Methylomirabilota bacterium]|nr:hypothetical protein [Methylomirabilota bacterium]
MNAILEEIRKAYEPVGITVEEPVAYGTYYRLSCAGCGKTLGNVGDKLLPGMIKSLVDQQLDLYATGAMGCSCGFQAERAKALIS